MTGPGVVAVAVGHSASSLSHLDAIMPDWVAGPDFDQPLIGTVRSV